MKFLQKNKMKLIGSILAFRALPFAALAGDASITAVTVQQRYPWNGLVDITVAIQGMAVDVANCECLFVATNSATKAVIPVGHITLNGDDSESGTAWTRKFIWNAQADVGAVKIEDVVLSVEAKPIGVQLWENGPYWAECNVGATKPEEYGYYFWWGDTVGYKRNANNNGWISVKNSSDFSFTEENCPTYDKNISQLQSAGYIDASGNLVAKYDAATAHLGAQWRMPTDAEFASLVSNCTISGSVLFGVHGRTVRGKGAYWMKSIFLPAAGEGYGSDLYSLDSDGYFWSSTPFPDDFYASFFLCYISSSLSRGGSGRYRGHPIRPVRRFAN